jgi:hypothetical protein
VADTIGGLEDELKPEQVHFAENSTDAAVAVPDARRPNLRDPQVVLSLLEADQVVAAKRRTRFGKRQLSPGMRLLLWGLRFYVVIMLIIVLFSVLQAVGGGR